MAQIAQISLGVVLGYREVPIEETARPASPTYTYIPTKTVPALGSAPATLDITDLTQKAHTYIKGLEDSGGALDFTINMTSDILTAVDAVLVLQKTKTIEWAVEFPAPLSRRFYFNGQASPVRNSDVAVDAVVEGTFSIIANNVIEQEAIV